MPLASVEAVDTLTTNFLDVVGGLWSWSRRLAVLGLAATAGDRDRFDEVVVPRVTSVARQAALANGAYLRTLLGTGPDPQDIDIPDFPSNDVFMAARRALEEGADPIEAWDRAESAAELAASNQVHDSMSASNQSAQRNGLRTGGWRRTPHGQFTCDYCVMISGIHYYTEETAYAGSHDFCDCVALPIKGALDPGLAQNREDWYKLKEIPPDQRSGYFNTMTGEPVPRVNGKTWRPRPEPKVVEPAAKTMGPPWARSSLDTLKNVGIGPLGGTDAMTTMLRHGMEQVDTLIRVPEGYSVDFTMGGAGSAGGLYNKRDHIIKMSRAGLGGDRPAAGFAVIHEYGHSLDFDQFGSGQRGMFKRGGSFAKQGLGPEFLSVPEVQMPRGDPDFDGWWRAVQNSGTVQEMRRGFLTDAAGKKYALTNEGQTYVLSPQELFARSFSQWVTVRTQDATLLADLAKHGLELGQWKDDEFGPIAKALDDLFRAKGMLK